LVNYVQYQDSHCLNGAVLRVPDGHQLMQSLGSHHALLLSGNRTAELDFISRVFDWKII
jgi:hypothetical protein